MSKDMNNSSDLSKEDALRTIVEGSGLSWGDESSPESGSLGILNSALAALSEGRISELVEQFDDRFIFKDHALTLEFTEKT